MEHKEIASMFRQAELDRREARRQRLKGELTSIHKRMQNEGMLLEEVLTEEEMVIHLISIEQMQKQKDELDKAIRGYWRRLWRALLNQ